MEYLLEKRGHRHPRRVSNVMKKKGSTEEGEKKPFDSSALPLKGGEGPTGPGTRKRDHQKGPFFFPGKMEPDGIGGGGFG